VPLCSILLLTLLFYTVFVLHIHLCHCISFGISVVVPHSACIIMFIHCYLTGTFHYVTLLLGDHHRLSRALRWATAVRSQAVPTDVVFGTIYAWAFSFFIATCRLHWWAMTHCCLERDALLFSHYSFVSALFEQLPFVPLFTVRHRSVLRWSCCILYFSPHVHCFTMSWYQLHSLYILPMGILANVCSVRSVHSMFCRPTISVGVTVRCVILPCVLGISFCSFVSVPVWSLSHLVFRIL